MIKASFFYKDSQTRLSDGSNGWGGWGGGGGGGGGGYSPKNIESEFAIVSDPHYKPIGIARCD